jgi:UDP-3-O-[3-hydroxymyristoyl] glucosamine N-acyltransferase
MKRLAKELAAAIGAKVEGDGALELAGVAGPERAGTRDLIYVEAAKHPEWMRMVSLRMTVRCSTLPAKESKLYGSLVHTVQTFHIRHCIGI